jgi:hypothetical protein
MPDPRPEDIPEDADPVCGKCKQPAEFRSEAWRHASLADKIFCDILFGGMASDRQGEEPEPGGATSAWEHHHG